MTSLDMTLTPVAPQRVEVRLDVSLLNEAGHRELNLADSPQPMFLRLTNRSAEVLQVPFGALVVVRFRPGVLRGIEHVQLGPDTAAGWDLEYGSADPGDELRLVARSDSEIALGASLELHLQGIAAEPAGGTRVTRVELDYSGFATDGPMAGGQPASGRQLLHLSVRRSHFVTHDLTAVVGAGSVATVGPITGGFLTGAGALNTGEALNELVLQLANTSGRPLRLSAEGDEATRIVFSYGTGTPGAPWGLLGHHGDHFAVATEPNGWVLEAGTSLRYDDDDVGAWSPNSPLLIPIELHTSAPACQAQLIVRIENLPGYDDLTLVLLVDIGPLAVSSKRSMTTRPIQLWGTEAPLEFFASSPKGGDDEPLANAILHARPGAGLTISAPSVELGEVMRIEHGAAALSFTAVADRFSIEDANGGPLTINPLGGSVATGGALFVGGALPVTQSGNIRPVLTIGPEHGTNLHFGFAGDGTAIQSSTGVELRINPLGPAVSLGEAAIPTSEFPVNIRGPLAVTVPASTGAAVGLSLGRQDDFGKVTTRVRLEASHDEAILESARLQPLRINPNGVPVSIGGALEVGGALTVGGALEVVTSFDRGTMFSVRASTVDAALDMGVSPKLGWIQTTGGLPLWLNSGGQVVIQLEQLRLVESGGRWMKLMSGPLPFFPTLQMLTLVEDEADEE